MTTSVMGFAEENDGKLMAEGQFVTGMYVRRMLMPFSRPLLYPYSFHSTVCYQTSLSVDREFMLQQSVISHITQVSATKDFSESSTVNQPQTDGVTACQRNSTTTTTRARTEEKPFAKSQKHKAATIVTLLH